MSTDNEGPALGNMVSRHTDGAMPINTSWSQNPNDVPSFAKKEIFVTRSRSKNFNTKTP